MSYFVVIVGRSEIGTVSPFVSPAVAVVAFAASPVDSPAPEVAVVFVYEEVYVVELLRTSGV